LDSKVFGPLLIVFAGLGAAVGVGHDVVGEGDVEGGERGSGTPRFAPLSFLYLSYVFEVFFLFDTPERSLN